MLICSFKCVLFFIRPSEGKKTYYQLLSMNLCIINVVFSCSMRTIKLHFGCIRERRGLVFKALKEENVSSNQISTSVYHCFFIRRQMKWCFCLCALEWFARVRMCVQEDSNDLFILGSCLNCFCQEYLQAFQLVAQAFSAHIQAVLLPGWTKVLIQALAHTAVSVCVCLGGRGVQSQRLCTCCSSEGRPDGVFLNRHGQFIHPSLQ